ncbi:pseudouridine-5'-phosphatase-like [Oppia nitens]|uniref:pseudouridine-5'-phosphatase-like n=1 Tax=Oppia nitens TaxID=1686743 RepID=UPI0023DC79F2|nr:pseudouridine-5'-phosphatase-like [Oppia nitens]
MTAKQFKTVSHVVFDMDGLLLDTETRYEIAIRNVLARYDKPYLNELKVRLLGVTDEAEADIVCTELELPITPNEYMDQLKEEFKTIFDNVPLMPGAERLVLHLHKHNIPIAIATNTKRDRFDRKTRHLQHIFKLFHHIVICSDDPEITRGKPDPQPYEVCANRFTAKPQSMQNVLVFEDSPTGVTSGLAAGCQVVWVPAVDIDKNLVKPTLTLNSLEEFEPQLFGLPNF